jgi:hypothetical protein
MMVLQIYSSKENGKRAASSRQDINTTVQTAYSRNYQGIELIEPNEKEVPLYE